VCVKVDPEVLRIPRICRERDVFEGTLGAQTLIMQQDVP
jgi:hypothetical protein